MDIQTLTNFFMWCMIINISIFIFWTVFLIAAPDFTYRLQTKFFPLKRETFDVIIYAFLATFKILFLFFNLVPYVALRIIG